jgi:hypothetical protein
MLVKKMRIACGVIAAVLCAGALYSWGDVAFMQTKLVPAGPNYPVTGTGNISGASAFVPMTPGTFIPIAISAVVVAQKAQQMCNQVDTQCPEKLDTDPKVKPHLKTLSEKTRNQNGRNISFVPLCRSLLTLIDESLVAYCESISKTKTIAQPQNAGNGSRTPPSQTTKMSDHQWAKQLVHSIVQHVRNKKAVCDGFVGVANFFSATQFAQELKSLCQQLEMENQPAEQKNFGNNANAKAYEQENRDSKRIIRSLDADTREAVKKYTAIDAIAINHCLRGTSINPCDKTIQEKVNRITSALAKKKLGNIVLYRGGGYSLVGVKRGDAAIKDPSTLVGTRIRDDAFMSTTINNKLDQSMNSIVPLHDVLLVIQNTAGTEGLAIESISTIPQEKEVLLQRGTEYEIREVQVLPSGMLVAYVWIIPRDTQQKTNKNHSIKKKIPNLRK